MVPSSPGQPCSMLSATSGLSSVRTLAMSRPTSMRVSVMMESVVLPTSKAQAWPKMPSLDGPVVKSSFRTELYAEAEGKATVEVIEHAEALRALCRRFFNFGADEWDHFGRSAPRTGDLRALCAARRQRQRMLASQATTRAGDDGNLVFQSHAVLLCRHGTGLTGSERCGVSS